MSELKQPMRDSEQPWLEKAITEIRRQNLCFAYWCQLCPPRVVEHLRIAVAEHTGASPGRQIAESEILAITKGLAELDFSPGDQELEIPVRFILGRILWVYQDEEYAETRLAPLLAGSSGGDVLERMKAHSAAVERKRAQDADYVAQAPLRRQARKEERAARHAERMQQQADYNRRWYEARENRDTT